MRCVLDLVMQHRCTLAAPAVKDIRCLGRLHSDGPRRCSGCREDEDVVSGIVCPEYWVPSAVSLDPGARGKVEVCQLLRDLVGTDAVHILGVFSDFAGPTRLPSRRWRCQRRNSQVTRR